VIDIYICLYNTSAMKRTSLFLKDDQLKKLEAISEKTGAPVAELIRRAIDYWLKAKKEA
jgi:predicted DNA-binding protein